MPQSVLSLFVIILSLVSTLAISQPKVPADIDTLTIEQLKHKVEQGDLAAELLLADKLYKGEGTEKNLADAAKLYTHLANEGFMQAQITLGLMNIKGEGVEKNDQRAIELFHLAAEQKSSLAQYLIGIAYEGGHGVDADKIKAYMWYEISAAMNYTNALDAQKLLAPKMTKEQILIAEQMASDWWLQYHQ